MTPNAKPALLCVDDEPLVLEGLTLHLRRGFTVTTATSGAAGLEILKGKGPFAIVMSDMRMPGMSGAEFLSKVREGWSDTVRILLTGQSDLPSAIAAVNDGQVFRFLTKPCPPEILLGALSAAAKQHDLVSSERVLLEQTLHGSVKALTDVLGLANPVAFGRANRAKVFMAQLLAEMQRPSDWICDVAAMLSQIGCVTIPAETLERMYDGSQLTPEEAAMAARLPAVAVQLLGSIPRLEGVRDILAHMDDHYEPTKAGQTKRGEAIPWGARALKVILDYLTLEARLGTGAEALDTMRARKGWYDAAIFAPFAEIAARSISNVEVRHVVVRELRQGMILRDNLFTKTGMLLVTKGNEVTPGLIERIANFSRKMGVREPISVTVPAAAVQPKNS
ncbi:MAG TPA: HD domain-containing phosphohydrolase [Polyangiaceae bacterium]|nr:HD domain-containing phosphohydrolase [Polyangiaceae bacterium]